MCTETDSKKGNGILEPGEDCDHGSFNGQDGDSCSSECKWVDCDCGNGITGTTHVTSGASMKANRAAEYPEECDDGDLNGKPWSQCSTNCTWITPCGNPNPPRCGDGIVQWPEVCDNGWANGQAGSNCSTSCTHIDGSPPKCGDGHVDSSLGETCDDGPLNGSEQSNCDSDCHVKYTSTCPQTCNPNPVSEFSVSRVLGLKKLTLEPVLQFLSYHNLLYHHSK